MSDDRETALCLFDCPEGFLLYERESSRLHLMNHTGLLLWNLLREEDSVESVLHRLESIDGLPQPPVEQVRSFQETLTERGLITAAVEVHHGGSAELNNEDLWTTFGPVAERILSEAAWEAPVIHSFPFDDLQVTSAKCSSRWANLDDNTSYAPAANSRGSD